jgi:hypothetical protein
MIRRICLILGVSMPLLLGGCSAYVEDYHFVPRPALTELPPVPPEQVPPFVAMASIIGIRREDSKEMLPTSIEVRMRLENAGSQSVQIDPRTLDLTNGELLKFPPPIVRPPGPIAINPTQMVVISAFFPFPPGSYYGNVDLNSLELRWLVQIGGKSIPQAVYFQRIYETYYYNPYWDDPPYGWYGGVVVGGVYVVHRR